MTYTCGTCWREFPAGWHARQQHLSATGHMVPLFECETCGRIFNSHHAVEQHMDALNHWDDDDDDTDDDDDDDDNEYECHDCYDFFQEEHILRGHEVSEHLYCDTCDRYFSSLSSIVHHLNTSRVHSADRFQYYCLENGLMAIERTNDSKSVCGVQLPETTLSRVNMPQNNAPPSSMPPASNSRMNLSISTPPSSVPSANKSCINTSIGASPSSTPPADNSRMSISHILNPAISHPQTEQKPNKAGSTSEKSDTAVPELLTRYEATEKSFNWKKGSYECYICHGLFRQLPSLNQHLASPLHQQRVYHCVNRHCQRSFKNLGAIMEHLENERCAISRFETMQQRITRMKAC